MRTYRLLPFLVVFLLPGPILAEDRKPAFLGVSLSNAPHASGSIVNRIIPETAAKSAGLLVGDVILQANDAKAPYANAVTEMIRQLNAGEKLSLRIRRGDTEKVLSIKLGKRPKPSKLLEQLNPPRTGGGQMVSRGGTFQIGLFHNRGDFIVIGGARIVGSYKQSWTAVLDVTIRDRNKRSVALISGDASIDGILHVSFDGFLPKLGDSFELISGAETLNGKFAELMLPDAPKGLQWKLIYDDLKKGLDLDGDGKNDVTLTLIADRVSK